MGYSPMNDGPGEAFWLGVGSPEAIRRQRMMADGVAPGFAAALRANGPIDALALCAQGIAMGDDCHMRHQATTMLLLREALPAMAEHAPDSVLPTARMLAANGHFALTMTIAAARAALMGIQGTPTRAWWCSSAATARTPPCSSPGCRTAGSRRPRRWWATRSTGPGFSDEDAAPDIGDSALVECCGLGAAASAASPSVAAFLGGGLADALERTREMGDICIGSSERLRMPMLDGEGTPLGVDARACVDLGATPLINTGILHREDGGQIGAGIARTPVEPIRDALAALAAELRGLTDGLGVGGPELPARLRAPARVGRPRSSSRVRLRGDEDVLDAGCGTGRVTRLLAERVPDGTVLGVDGSQRMVEEATAQLADLAPRVRFAQADLTELELPEPVDVIVSTATFHWILDHDLLFRRLHAALRPGGLLVAQCGGDGNIARTLAAAEAVALASRTRRPGRHAQELVLRRARGDRGEPRPGRLRRGARRAGGGRHPVRRHGRGRRVPLHGRPPAPPGAAARGPAGVLRP